MKAYGFCTVAALLLLALAWNPAMAANPWFTARTINGSTQPLSAGTESFLTPEGQQMNIVSAALTNGLVDVVISLYDDPDGDDDGNTQDVDPDSREQDNYEKIIRYFADGVYEQTDGAHALRNVRIYRKASRPDADVIWNASGHPHARPLNQEGKAASINMYSVFGTVNFITAANHEEGGYTLAHEFGHYFYGLFDEYCYWGWNGVKWTWIELAANARTIPCIMNDHWSADGRDYRWLNHSIRYNTASAAYADYECRNQTAQYQFYGDGAWPIMVRNPTHDPLDTALRQWARQAYGTRLYYPELAAVAPAGTNPPQVDLSAATALTNLASRADLNIMWMSDDYLMMLVIETSGRMQYGNFMECTKCAARMLVDRVANGSWVGIVKFDGGNVEVIMPPAEMTGPTDRVNVKYFINNNIYATHNVGGNIGMALQYCLLHIRNFDAEHPNRTRIAVLMSDRYLPAGDWSPLVVAGAYQNYQIPVIAGCLDWYYDPSLELIAGQTGGRYLQGIGRIFEIVGRFKQVLAEMQARHNLISGVALASSTAGSKSASIHIPFQVEAGLSNLSASVGYALSNTVSLVVQSPDSTQYMPSSTNLGSAEAVLEFFIESPAAGEWALVGTTPAGLELSYQVDAGNGTNFTYYLSACSVDSNAVVYPTPIQIWATLTHGDAAVKNAALQAVITDPQTNRTTLTLSNAFAGIYSGTFVPSLNGKYDIQVSANNNATAALLSWDNGLPSPLPDGTLPTPIPDEAISEPFMRTTAFQVDVSGMENAAAPAAPAAVTATQGDCLDYVKISWASVANASVYTVWRAVEGSDADAVEITRLDRAYTNYMDSAVIAGSRYYYAVCASNAVSTSGLSDAAYGWPLFGPGIRVNDAHSLTLGTGNIAEVTVLLRTGEYTGVNCDWWVVAYAESAGALFYLDGSLQWQQVGDIAEISTVYQGPIFDMADPYTVLTHYALPAGVYRFYFGLDVNPNGVLDENALYYDTAVLTVQ